MSGIHSRLQFDVLLDPYFHLLDMSGMYSFGDSRLLNLILSQARRRFLHPFEWDLTDPLAVGRSSAMYLYLVPRGQYPSRLTSKVVTLSPGRAYDVAIVMQDTLWIPADFLGECVDQEQLPAEARTVQFADPHSGAAESFRYSEAHCYYKEMARDAQRRYNCSLVPRPTPWEFRHLSLCFNLTAASVSGIDELKRRIRLGVAARERGLMGAGDNDNNNTAWDTTCAVKRLCQHRLYTATTSYGVWPNQGSLIRMVDHIIASLVLRRNPSDFRSLFAGVRVMNLLRRDRISEVLGFEEGIANFFKQAAFRVTLRTEASLSSLTTFRLEYRLPNFIADFGSALGLYLGCSVLTLLETFELLHNLLRSFAKRDSEVEAPRDVGDG